MKHISNILLLFLLSITVFAQEPSLKNYDITKGLPSNECYKIIQDQKGYIWIASDKGLSRYNGYSFQNFTKTDGLPDNVIIHLFEDARGRIWVIGLNSRIAYFENETFYAPKELNQFLKTNVKKAQISSAYVNDENELQLGFDPFYPYLLTYSLSEGKILEQKKINDDGICIRVGKHTDFIYGVCPNNAHNLQLSVESEKKPRPSVDINFTRRSGYIKYLYIDKYSYLLSFDYKLFIVKDQKIYTLSEFNANVLFLYKNDKGKIWVSVQNQGIYIFNATDIISGKSQHILDGYSFSSITADKEKNYWLSSLKGGIYQIPNFDITHYQIKENDKNIRMNVVAKYNDIIYTGGLAKDIYAFDKNNKLTKCFELLNKNVEIFDMQAQRNKLILLGSSSYIASITENNVNIEVIKTVEQNEISTNSYLKFFNAGSSYKDSVLAGNSRGCIYLNLNTGKNIFNHPLPPDKVNSIYTDSVSNKTYIACINGLYFTENFKSYTKVKDILLSTRINNINKKDTLFLLSSEEMGLILWDGKNTWTINMDNGLLSNVCKKTLLDSKGNIWLATNKGLSKIEQSTNAQFEINTLTTNEGLTSNDIYNFSIIDDTVWIPTTSGITKFSTDIQIKNNISPPVYITSISVDDSLYKGIASSEIPYRHNYIKINYNALSYKSNGELMYEYRLIGLDSNWKKTKNIQVQFNKLAAGEYSFQIRAIKNGNIKSIRPANYNFIIYPPWYKTGWFFFLSFIGTVLLMYLFFLLRFNKFKEREREKTRLLTQITETEIKVLRAQTNPHFIFNALNSIGLFVLKNDSENAHYYLMQFAQLMRDVLENSENEVISLDKEISILKIYMELEALRFGGKYSFKINVEKDVDITKILIPPLLLQPIIENAIWHGLMPLEDREGFLMLKIGKTNDIVTITIEDNGIGRQRSAEIKLGMMAHKSSKGIHITESRIDLFNKKNKEKIRIITTDLTDDHLTPTGTKVEIIIAAI